MNLQYISAEETDIPVILEQVKTLIDAYEDLASIDYDKVLAWMQRKIEMHISEYRCVMTDGEKCAYYRLCDDGELDDFYVLPGFQSHGIGTEILRKCIVESENPLYLYVFSRNERAISFYEKSGFSVRETISTTRLIMERKG